jgi:hypothetical protein
MFEPVIGYRVHRVDRHDPALLSGDVPGFDADFPAPVRAVSVVPEAYYRSQPDTVAVIGLNRSILASYPTGISRVDRRGSMSW